MDCLPFTAFGCVHMLSPQELIRSYESRLLSVEAKYKDEITELQKRAKDWEVQFYQVTSFEDCSHRGFISPL